MASQTLCMWRPMYTSINMQYDIVLDVLAVNQTGDTLQGLSLELATLGDYACMT